MRKTWLISDTHFCHKNILKLSRPQFKDIAEMNQTIVENWNSVVGKEDRVFMLGDFAFAGSQVWSNFVSLLNGNIEIVLGNHDRRKGKGQQWFIDKGFYRVHTNPIIVDDFWILSHEPIEYLSESMPYVNIHGHLHERRYENKQFVNVCCEQIGYTPIDFDDIKNMFKEEDVSE